MLLLFCDVYIFQVEYYVYVFGTFLLNVYFYQKILTDKIGGGAMKHEGVENIHAVTLFLKLSNGSI